MVAGRTKLLNLGCWGHASLQPEPDIESFIVETHFVVKLATSRNSQFIIFEAMLMTWL